MRGLRKKKVNRFCFRIAAEPENTPSDFCSAPIYKSPKDASKQHPFSEAHASGTGAATLANAILPPLVKNCLQKAENTKCCTLKLSK
jgi:hypothetical protein